MFSFRDVPNSPLRGSESLQLPEEKRCACAPLFFRLLPSFCFSTR
jgi:hypothetical protein